MITSIRAQPTLNKNDFAGASMVTPEFYPVVDFDVQKLRFNMVMMLSMQMLRVMVMMDDDNMACIDIGL